MVFVVLPGLVAVILLYGIGRLRAMHQAALDQRRSTIRALHRFRDYVQCSGGAAGDPDVVSAEVVRALVDLLALDDCWYEPYWSEIAGAAGEDESDGMLPVLDSEGHVSGRIHRWRDTGLVLPGAVSIPTYPRGRYVLVGSPDIGTTTEQRLLAHAVVATSAPTGRASGSASPPAAGPVVGPVDELHGNPTPSTPPSPQHQHRHRPGSTR